LRGPPPTADAARIVPGGIAMRCRYSRILITKSIYEALDPKEGAALARHLERCASCRAEREAERRLEAMIQPLRSHPSASAPPASFTRRINERPRVPLRRAARLVMAGAALGAAAIAAAFLLPGLRHQSAAPKIALRPRP